jgi:hypothetical protein
VSQGVRVICPDPKHPEIEFALRDVQDVEVVAVGLRPEPTDAVEVLVGEAAMRLRLPKAHAVRFWAGSLVPVGTDGCGIVTYDPAWVAKGQWKHRWHLGASVAKAQQLAQGERPPPQAHDLRTQPSRRSHDMRLQMRSRCWLWM